MVKINRSIYGKNKQEYFYGKNKQEYLW